MNRSGMRLAGAIAMFTAGMLFPQIANASDSDPVAQGAEIIVHYAPGTSGAERADARQGADVNFRESLLLPRTQVVNPGPDQSLKGAISDLEGNPDVLYAEPNYLQQPQDDPPQVAPPNDTYFGNQWGLYNFGQTLTRGLTDFPGTAGDDIDARHGWFIHRTSTNVITAVIDSGIDTDNPDLVDQIWTNPGEIAGNGIDDDHNGYADDVHGWDFLNDDNDPEDALDHGTHVSGTIGATGNNGIGGAGVSWDAKIMPLRICPATGGCPVSAMVDAITYASHMGATVANISIGGHSFSQTQRNALRDASNVLFTIAAGNDANDGIYPFGDNELSPTFPCQADQLPINQPAFGNIICVGASDQNDDWANFSNFGPTSVDLAAPGKNILSTIPNWSDARPMDTFESTAGWNVRPYTSLHTDPPVDNQWEQGPIGLGSPQTGGITDSYGTNYAPAIDSIATSSSGMDLAGKTGCSAEYFFKSNTEDDGTVSGSDWFYFEAAHDPGGPWTTLDGWKGAHSGTITPGYVFSRNDGHGDLGGFEGDSSVYFRFRLHPDSDLITDTGAYVDNFKVRCAGAGGTVGYLDGTSMAAPHVAGLATLVRSAAPGLSTAEVKTAILDGVDPVPAFATAGLHPTVTGGREDIYNTLSSLDLTPPDAPQLQSPANGAQIWEGQRFSWSVSDITANYELVLDDGEVVTGGPGLSNGEFDIPPGRHKWFVRATDDAGNVSRSPTRTFTYSRNPKISIRSVKVRRGPTGGAVVRVKLPARGRVKVTATKTRQSGAVLAKGSSSTPSARTVVVVLRLTNKGKAGLRGRQSLNAFVGAVYRPFRDPAHTGKATRRGRIGSPGQ